MGNRVGLILGAVRPRTALFSCVLPSWVATWERQIMTDDQVNLVVQHLCEHLHLALRLKGSEAHPPNAKDIGFDPAAVRTVLLTCLRSAGVTMHYKAVGESEEPPWS
jgi:hypothetical protein